MMLDFRQLLQTHNLRITPIRLAVLKLLDNSPHPLDIPTLSLHLSKAQVSADTVTLYRCLQSLVEAGIATSVDFREGKLRYELAGDHHHHLVCTECQSVTPIHEACVSVSNSEIHSKYQFQVSHHHLEFFGLCGSCQKRVGDSNSS